MKYFDESMSANQVRARLYDLLYIHRVPEREIPLVKHEHKKMCNITVRREIELANQGWLMEEI